VAVAAPGAAASRRATTGPGTILAAGSALQAPARALAAPARVAAAQARALAAAQARALAAPTRALAARGIGLASAPPPLNPDCLDASDPLARADELMANQYRLGTPLSVLGSHPIVTLPANPTWTEDPLHDWNWQFQFHAMRYVLDLFTATRLTGDTAYEDRGLFLLHDWVEDNPRNAAPTVWAWNDHATALRAVVLACAADVAPMTTWLHDALVLHGQTLADPAFFVKQGNHALNQAIGLLEIGRVLDRADWRALAGARINALIVTSLDAQGVSNEQSVGYEDYNFERYHQAEARMLALGLTPDPAFARLDRMPEFLAQATLPDGTYEMIGDSGGLGAIPIPGTVAEYAATRGAAGPKPSRTIARYDAGYLFARTGWGEHRPLSDETFFAVKWGPAPIIHGHADGLELTLAAFGARLLVDHGLYTYTPSAFRTFFKQRDAHNVVSVDGAAWRPTATSRLLGYRATSSYVDLRLATAGYAGVAQTRRITWSRTLDYLLVEDRLVSSTIHTYRQLWHLPGDARPAIGVSSVWTRRARSNVLIRQLAGLPALRVVTGRTAPVQGWISYEFGLKIAAPVAEAVQRGSSVRYLTLIVPAAAGPAASVSQLRLTSTGYSVTVTIGAHAERVTVSGSSIWLHELS
jgi:hypothetical protein